MGVKDGVGTSTFAYQLALALKKTGKNVLLLDGDAAHQGDLQLVSKTQIVWRNLDDLQKVPRPVTPSFLYGFLRGPEGIPSLQLATDRFQLKSKNPKDCLKALSEIVPFFDWVVADTGSHWNPYSAQLLNKADLLLFALNPHVTLIKEAKRKLEELTISYFPLKKVGWLALKWDFDSFLSIASVEELLKISCFGTTATESLLKLQKADWAVEGMQAFLPDLLYSVVDEKNNKSFLSNPSPNLNDRNEIKELKIQLLKEIQERMESKGIKEEEGVRSKVSKIILEVFNDKSDLIPSEIDRSYLLEELLDELLGLGPLEKLLGNENSGEILVNGTNTIYIEEKGQLQKTPFQFLSRDSLQKTIERILLPTGRRIDESSPMVDARLQCGSRINMIIPPLALDGPIISIRRFSKKIFNPQDLVGLGSLSSEMVQFLETSVASKLNILVAGGTGSGKTTLLNVLSSFIPEDQRIITIEDAAELSLNQPHVVRLESRPPNIEGKGAVTIRDLVRNALRMRPDRIVVGECRGAEALDMLQAMNTGHDGSLTTLHANSPRDALTRLETLVMFAGMELPSKAIREQIVSAIDLIVQVARLDGGCRKIVSIMKLEGMEQETFTLQNLFVYENGTFKKEAL